MMRNEAVISKGVDWIMVWLYFILVAIGFICIFSVEHRSQDNFLQTIIGLKKNYSRQFLFIAISAVVATFLLLTDSKLFTATANLTYAFGLVLMIATFFVGKEINGSRSWIPLGFFNLQPVETCKIFTALALAKYLSRSETDFDKPQSQIIAALFALIPIGFSLMQNETGLALVYFAFLIPMYREGLPAIYLIIGFSLAVLIVATILIEKNTLAIILTVIAAATIYFMRKIIMRQKQILLVIIGIWV
ncbi:MAG TPA: rod shape-determining protein RodA, partial [Chitinophagaceae bacterium]|nr:rod shape-determining protein RodA [Chitinophagaceae bacterium]